MLLCVSYAFFFKFQNDMQSRYQHMASTEQKTAYDDTLRLVEEPNVSLLNSNYGDIDTYRPSL